MTTMDTPVKRIIVFDWDDTLLPNFLSSKVALFSGIKDLNTLTAADFVDEKQVSELTLLDKLIVSVFEEILGLRARDNTPSDLLLLLPEEIKQDHKAADKNNYLFIVTNSEEGWVNLSASIFLPRTHQFILKHNRPAVKTNDSNSSSSSSSDDTSSSHLSTNGRFFVISARTAFEKTVPDDPVGWKLAVFREIMDAMLSNPDDTIDFVSYGDGLAEKYAAMRIAEEYADDDTEVEAEAPEAEAPTLKVKIIQLIDRPVSVNEIYHQLDFIQSSLRHIFDYTFPLNVRITIGAPDVESGLVYFHFVDA